MSENLIDTATFEGTSQTAADALVNLTLERCAAALERRTGNVVYRKAWKVAAGVVRSFKKTSGEVSNSPQSLPQISSGYGRKDQCR